MKHSKIFFIFICVVISSHSFSQLICIKSFEQNDSLSSGVTNFVKNGSFENHTCSMFVTFTDCVCPNSVLYDCDINDWTCTGGGTYTYISIMNNYFSSVPQGTAVVYFGNDFAKSCSPIFGDTSCWNHSFSEITGIPNGYPISGANYGSSTGVSIEQNIVGLTVGQTYALEFWAGGEYDNGRHTKNSVFAIDIGFGYSFLKCKPTGTITRTNIGTRYLIEFSATNTSHNLKFTNWGHMCDSCTELIIDDVRLYPISQLSPTITTCYFGIEENSISGNNINISPNPIINELLINCSINEELQITLYDLTLKKIVEKNLLKTYVLI